MNQVHVYLIVFPHPLLGLRECTVTSIIDNLLIIVRSGRHKFWHKPVVAKLITFVSPRPDARIICLSRTSWIFSVQNQCRLYWPMLVSSSLWKRRTSRAHQGWVGPGGNRLKFDSHWLAFAQPDYENFGEPVRWSPHLLLKWRIKIIWCAPEKD